MNSKFKFIKGLVVVFTFAILFSSCEALYPTYQVRVENKMQATVFNIPSNKYDLIELSIGDIVFNDVEYGGVSAYKSIGTGEYQVSVKVDAYNIDSYGNWNYTGVESYDLGSVTFATNESYENFTIYLDTYLLIPSMEVYGDE